MAENDGKIIIGIEGDPSGVNKALADTEKKGKETASNLSAAFGAVAGAIAGAKIFGAFKSALDEANKLEASLNRVESAAKAFGLSTSKARDAAINLAKDGFLSLNQSASALSNLMSTGLNIDQSKKFLEASKNIAAFGNTVGDASSAVESGIKGIITGSSELVENMSPKMKQLSMRFTENKTKVGEAKAIQTLYNDVLKLGNQYQGDAARYLDTAAAAQKRFTAATDSASAAIGKALQPAMKSLFNTLTGIVEGVTKFFTSLDGSTQLVLIMGAAVASLSGVLVALLPVLRAISLSNPFGWITLAIVGFTALTAAIVEFQNKSKPENIVKAYKSTAKEIQDLGAKAAELSKINNRTAAEERQLVETKEALRKKAKELGLNYDELAGKAKNYLEVAEAIKNAEREKTKGSLVEQRDAYLREAARIRAEGRRFGQGKGSGFEKGAKELELKAQGIDKEIIDIYSEYGEGSATARALVGGGGKGSPEFRFIAARDELKKLETEYKQYIATTADAEKRNEAGLKLKIQQDLIINDIRKSYAEYIEDTADAERRAREDEYNKQIANLFELRDAGEDVEEELHKARMAFQKRETDARLKSFADTASAANTIAGGVGSIAKAKDLGSGLSGAGGVFGGIGQLGERFKSFGMIGQALGAFGGIASVMQGLFGKSDEQRKSEAERAERQREEQLKISEMQANYLKAQLAIAEANAKLPFENLQRNLRLIDIQTQAKQIGGMSAEDANAQRLTLRSGAINKVISEQAGAISAGAMFSNQAIDAPSLTEFLNKRAQEKVAVDTVLSIVQNTAGSSVQELQTALSQVQSLKGQVPDAIYNSAVATLERTRDLRYLQGVFSSVQQQSRLEYEQTYSPHTQSGAGYTFSGSYEQMDWQAQAALGSVLAGGKSTLGQLGSEFATDVGIAENLISVLEQSQATQLEINANTRKTADNTSRLTQMREASILDLAGGGIRGFGSFFRTTAGNAFNSINSVINPSMPAMQTPSAISNSLSIATLTRGWQERTADGMESLVRIQTEALQLLAEIAINSNRAGDVGGSLSESELLNIMSKVRSRLV